MDIQKSKSRSKIDEKPRSENGKSGSKKQESPFKVNGSVQKQRFFSVNYRQEYAHVSCPASRLKKGWKMERRMSEVMMMGVLCSTRLGHFFKT